MRDVLRSFGFACLVAWSCGAAAADTGQPASGPGKRWRDGPVRYLLSTDEYARYGRLWTEEARGAFVERFWRRLDPDSTTPGNEFRDRYETRVEEANRRFGEPLSMGWRTDRGRILLLLGEPVGIRAQPGDPQSVGREIWTYARSTASGDVPLEIVFYLGTDGRYRLDPEPVDTRAPSPILGTRVSETEALRSQLRRSFPGLTSRQIDQLTQSLVQRRPATPALDPVSLPQLPPAVVPPHSGLTGGSRSGGLIQEDAYYFESQEGSVLAILHVTFRPPEARGDAWDPDPQNPGYGAVAYITQAVAGDEALRPRAEAVELVPHAGPEGDQRLYFVGRAFLEPGAYEVRIAVGDSLQRTLSVRSTTLLVPELGTGGFNASSVVAAETFGPLREGASSLFAVGSEEVVPRAGGIFHRGEPLRIYLQFYGAGLSPTGRPSVDVTFHFEREVGRRFQRQGEARSLRGASGESIGLALPVGDWPTGRYRVRVDLKDSVAGVRTTAEGAFAIAE
jgi:GWxTD domain-containing protein